MFKKLTYLLIGASAFIGFNAQAAVHALAPKLSYEIELFPNKTEELTNLTFFYIKAACEISAVDASDPIEIYGKNRSGYVNDIPVTKGTHLTIDVKDHDVLRLGAESAAQVELTNRGEHSIIARCHTE